MAAAGAGAQLTRLLTPAAPVPSRPRRLSIPARGLRFQVSADGGTEPLWARGSGEIFYRHGDEMRVVRTRTSPRFEFEAARTLFTASFYRGGESERTYDVIPDGQRVLAVRVPDSATPRRIDVVTHWLDELRREHTAPEPEDRPMTRAWRDQSEPIALTGSIRWTLLAGT